MGAIDYLREHVLDAKVKGNRLIVSPATKLTTDVRSYIKLHRLELMAEAAANDPDGEPQHPIHTAATASPEWIAARDLYVSHLMTCNACYAPKGRHCVTGAELRQRYNATTMEPTL
jgi:hypothetical protein